MALTKKDLEKKLRDAGVAKEAIDERLGNITDEQLKEFDGIPVAQVLKEMDVEPEQPEEDEPETFVLDEGVLKEFADITRLAVREEVKAQLKEALEGLELEVPDVTIKELPQLAQLAADIAEIKEAVAALTQDEQERLKEKIADMPRNGKLRVMRFKASKKPMMEDEEESEEDDEEDEEEEDGKKKFPFQKKEVGQPIIGADGFKARNMTEFISSGGK